MYQSILIMSASLPIKYYTTKYGDDTSAAFIHLVREIGQVAFAIETKNAPVLEAKLTEAVALLRFIAHSHKIDLESNTEKMYSKKLSISERKY
jgi:NTP pyrophosphatase (non-canonical NTP hydrolase)